MWKVKLVAIIVISLLTIIVLVQNTEVVSARVLFWTVLMSRALLMMLTFVLGFIVGILVATYFLRRKSAAAKSTPGPS
jgi:uncharacterized integral membrane protein